MSSGSVSLSTLSGKLMFRNFIYITPDFSVRILDGWIVFKWWKSYEPKVMHEGKTSRNLHYYITSALLGTLHVQQKNK